MIVYVLRCSCLVCTDCITHTESVQRKHRCDIVWGNAEQSLEYITVITLD